MKAEPGYQTGLTSYLEGALSSADGRPAVVMELARSTRDFQTEYHQRPLGWAWLGAAVALAALWGITMWSRRDRMAIYTTFGADTCARLLIQGTEWVTLSAPATVWGWAIAVTWSLGLGAPVGIALPQVTGHVVATWTGASMLVMLTSLIPTGSLLSALKEYP